MVTNVCNKIFYLRIMSPIRIFDAYLTIIKD